MARTLAGFNDLIGRRVYRSHNPLNAGIILNEVEGEPGYFNVKWLDGTTQIASCLSLKDFDSLIRDHEKKLLTHRKTLAKLHQMVVRDDGKHDWVDENHEKVDVGHADKILIVKCPNLEKMLEKKHQ